MYNNKKKIIILQIVVGYTTDNVGNNVRRHWRRLILYNCIYILRNKIKILYTGNGNGLLV
jgi:hypothetical protein